MIIERQQGLTNGQKDNWKEKARGRTTSPEYPWKKIYWVCNSHPPSWACWGKPLGLQRKKTNQLTLTRKTTKSSFEIRLCANYRPKRLTI